MRYFEDIFSGEESRSICQRILLDIAEQVNKRERARRMFIAHYLEDVPTKVIGQVFGCSGPNVRQIINKEMRRFRHPSNHNHFLIRKYPKIAKAVHGESQWPQT